MKRISILALPFFLGACAANIPSEIPEPVTPEEVVDEFEADWQATVPPITYVNRSKPVVLDAPLDLPSEISEKHLKLSYSANSTLSDLAPVLNTMGIYLIIPDSELRNMPVVFSEYEGTLGDFLKAFGVAYGISFNWNDGGVVTAEKNSIYMLTMPQDTALISGGNGGVGLSEVVKTMGAEDVQVSIPSGTVSYSADYRTHKRITTYMEQLNANASLVSLQVGIVSVQMEKARKTGFDWDKLSLASGDHALNSFSHEGQKDYLTRSGELDGDAVTGDNGNGSATVNVSVLGSNAKDFVTLGGLSGDGLTLSAINKVFSFGGFINMLSTYGDTQAEQSVMLKTLSGKEVQLTSGEKIPYVSEIGISSVSTSSSSDDDDDDNSSSSDNLLATVTVENLSTGLDLKMTPFYDIGSGLVTVDVDMKLNALLRFVNISAGNQIGQVTHPQTQEKTFTDVIKTRPGSTIVIGGLMDETITDSRQNLAILDRYKTASKDKDVKKTALFVVIRPTVTVFKSPEES